MHNQIMNYNTMGRPGSRQLPARPGKPQQGGRRPGPGSPVDPEELTRRLHIVLADQKAQADRRKRAAKQEAAAAAATAAKSPTAATFRSNITDSSSTSSARRLSIRKSWSILDRAKGKTFKTDTKEQQQQQQAKSRPEEAEGPYVPREAAAQFARTTTAVNMREGGGGLAHKLSRNALKFHLEGDHVDSNATAAEQTKALRQAQSRREQLHGRNQFQNSKILEESPDLNEEKAQNSKRHTFTAGFGGAGGADHQQQKKQRRSSTGDVLLEEGEKSFDGTRHALPIPPASPGFPDDSPPPKYFPPQDAAEHRVDWTQSDESRQMQRSKTVPLLLRRPASIWTLRGKLVGKDSKLARGEKEAAINSTVAAEPGFSKPTKIGFFSRFRR